jgi:hypothetical protein
VPSCGHHQPAINHSCAISAANSRMLLLMLLLLLLLVVLR